MILELFVWALLTIGLVCLAMAATARTLLWIGEWNGRPFGDRYVDWLEERAHSPKQARLFRLFWLGFPIGMMALLLGVVLLLRLQP